MSQDRTGFEPTSGIDGFESGLLFCRLALSIGRQIELESEISELESDPRPGFEPVFQILADLSRRDSNPPPGFEPVDWDNYHFALLPPWGYHAQIMKVLCEMVHLVHSISEKCPSAETGFEPGAHPTANALVVRLDVLTQVVPPSFGWMY